MAELRKFNFFDLNENVDDGALAEIFKDRTLTVVTSGHTRFFFGDGEGNIVILDKLFKATAFKAYNSQITHAQYIKHSPYLVTIGDDEIGINPLLKVWNMEIIDKDGSPRCVRVTRLVPYVKAAKVTALGIHESTTFMAIGFENGSILLFRGDVARDRSSKAKLLKDTGSNAITGLAFRTFALTSYLFVTTGTTVSSHDITSKDREMKWTLDNKGCAPNCCAMADLPQEAHFVVAEEDGVYCYTADGKGPCYAMSGKKMYMLWSKSYLAVVAKEKVAVNPMRPAAKTDSPVESHTVTILDIHNKMIVSTSTLPNVMAVLFECGSFYIVTHDHKLHRLAEKDVQSKLTLLFKKNFYDIAIRMAKSQHYDEDGLVDIFRQYGDHLNSKGDRAGAIEQYIKTIGKLEPSYIIRKFMDSAHMEQLMEYLQALHRKGFATGDHTTLLLNCYIKLGKATDLKDFIKTKGNKVDFDIDIALKVVRGVSTEDALSLAKSHDRHEWVLRILLEDLKRYQDAIKYISNLQFRDAEKCILDFGGVLIEHAPAETTSLLKELCIKYHSSSKPNTNQIFELDGMGPASARPQDFLHLFLLESEYLVDFLEHLVNSKTEWDTQIYNTLVEHYLVVWSKNNEGSSKSTVEQNLLKLLSNPNALYDREHVFILCEMYNFSPGRIMLYDEYKMHYRVIQAQVEQKNFKEVLSTCRKLGHQDPNIWIHALWAVAHHSDTPQHVLSEVLSVIDKERLQPPLMTVEALGEEITLGHAKRYFEAILQAEDDLRAHENAQIEKHSKETARVRTHIREIESNTIIFQGSRCSLCQRQLELPTIHFLCQHSYHQNCLQIYAENENECIECRKNNKDLLDVIKSQENSHELHEAFHGDLQKGTDSFKVVADYFGKGVFNKVAVPTPIPPTIKSVKVAAPPPAKKATNPFDMADDALEVSSQPEILERKSPAREAESDRLAFSSPFSAPDTSSRTLEPAPSLVTNLNPFDGDDDEDGDHNGNSTNPFADEVDDDESSTQISYNDELNPFA